MKKLLGALLCVFAVFTSCNLPEDKYILYADQPVFASPKDSVPFAIQHTSNEVPVRVRYYAKKHTWGMIGYEYKKEGDKKERLKCWINMTDSDMIVPCGTTDEEEVGDLCVMQKKVTLYSRTEDKKKYAVGTLKKNDIARSVYRRNGWVHLECGRYDKKGRHTFYGWAVDTTANFVVDTTVTASQYDLLALAMYDPNRAVKLKERRDEKSGKALLNNATMGKWYPILRIFFGVCAALCLVWIILLWSATERGQMDYIWHVIFGVCLGIAASIQYPHWYIVFFFIIVPFVVFYPILLTNKAQLAVKLYWIATPLLIAVYLFMLFRAHGYSGIEFGWRLFLYFFVLCFLFGLALVMASHMSDHICPHCGFYGDHPVIQTTSDSHTETRSSGPRDVFDHSETQGNVRINYYRRESSTWTVLVTNFHHLHRCINCNGTYYTHERKES